MDHAQTTIYIFHDELRMDLHYIFVHVYDEGFYEYSTLFVRCDVCLGFVTY